MTSSASQLRRRALLVLWLEVALRAAAPGALVLLAFLTLALFGMSGPGVQTGAFIALIGAGIYGVRGFHRPTMAMAERRLETQAGFIHQPLAALSDRPAMAGAASESLWRAHQAAMANQQSQLRSITPRIDASSHDPFALRAAILLLALVGVVVAGQTAPDRLRAAFALPELNFGPAATVTAWLTPPAYTGQAPVLIDPTNHIYRYWVTSTGPVPQADVTLTANGNAWALQQSDGTSIAGTGVTLVDMSLDTPYIDVGLSPTAGQTV
ncbi:MAG TPA: DUF4175 family protein, partial [Acetobacteraceae bacterium]|nr:DUF4175 family protein [Acetobacteraceae bacterium]